VDSRWLASPGEDHAIRIWALKTEDLIAQARLPRNLSREEWNDYMRDEPYSLTCGAFRREESFRRFDLPGRNGHTSDVAIPQDTDNTLVVFDRDRINLHAVVGCKHQGGRYPARSSTGKFGDHFRELTTGAIGRICQAKIFEDLQESLLLIDKAEVFPGTSGFAEEALTDDRQPPIA
jgi:hypothetical protein